MTRRHLPLLLFGSMLAAVATAQAQESTLEQDRQAIGDELEANSEQIRNEVRAVNGPASRSGMQAGEGTAAGETPGLVGERTPMSTDQPGLDDDPAGRTVPRGTVQPDDIPRPVTTPTPTPERDSPRGIEAVPPAGQPAPGVRVEPLPGSVPTRPGGNLGPDPMGPAGGNGTIEGNAPAGGSTGGATTDGPTGGAAGPGDED